MTDQATKYIKLHRHLALALLVGAASSAASAQTTAPAPVAPIAPAVPAAPVAPPQPTLAQMPGVTVQYYDVTGKTIPEIQASIAAQRPGAPATTTWSIGASVRRSTTGNQCKIIGANARLTANVVMPRLATTEGVPEPVLRQWQAYVAGLEQQQVALLSQPAARLGEVQRAAMASSCAGAQDAIKRAIATITAQTPAPAAPPPPPVG